MKYNDLSIDPRKQSRRVGRGISAGQGKTAGRGTKGQKSRTGYTKRVGFSGGQNPLMQQLPKLPGFRSYRAKAEVVKISQLEAVKAKLVNCQSLFEAGLITDPYARVKLLLGGQLKTAKTVQLAEASQSAIDLVTKAGGSFEKVERPKRPASKKDT